MQETSEESEPSLETVDLTCHAINNDENDGHADYADHERYESLFPFFIRIQLLCSYQRPLTLRENFFPSGFYLAH